MNAVAVHAGIGLGSNLGDRLANLRAARGRLLRAVGGDGVCAPTFETAPVGCEPGAGPFLNTVVEIPWSDTPERLLTTLAAVERQLGRPAAHARNRSRTVDLDLLYCGDLVRDTPALTLPHPRLAERRFVLAPLAVLRPDLRLPGQTWTVAELLAGLDLRSRRRPALRRRLVKFFLPPPAFLSHAHPCRNSRRQGCRPPAGLFDRLRLPDRSPAGREPAWTSSSWATASAWSSWGYRTRWT